MSTDKPILLFYHSTMETLAKRVVALPEYAGRVTLGGCSWETFKDGFPNIHVDPTDCMRLEQHDVAFATQPAQQERLHQAGREDVIQTPRMYINLYNGGTQ